MNNTEERQERVLLAGVHTGRLDYLEDTTEESLKELEGLAETAGASVYSASDYASQEFPEYDVTQRGAISIARRLQDPLAELVKIDPKSIGVGQYQHDMNPKKLSESLDGVVERSVNSVGIDLNTASSALMEHIAGISPRIAKNIVKYREENGSFVDRNQLLKVPGLGAKTFEQCAGFMRIYTPKNILDSTCVHPESYDIALALLTIYGYDLRDVKNGGVPCGSTYYGRDGRCRDRYG